MTFFRCHFRLKSKRILSDYLSFVCVNYNHLGWIFNRTRTIKIMRNRMKFASTLYRTKYSLQLFLFSSIKRYLIIAMDVNFSTHKNNNSFAFFSFSVSVENVKVKLNLTKLNVWYSAIFFAVYWILSKFL